MKRADHAHFRVIVAVCAGLAALQARPARAADAPSDYGQAAAWICRPGQEGACTTGLDAMIVAGDGTRTPEKFTPASDPPIDCFYVYPTVSLEPGLFADMTLSPEVVTVTLTGTADASGMKMSGGIYVDPMGADGDFTAVLQPAQTPS